MEQINGVDRDKYGLWCTHGKHVYVVDPEDTSDYPGTIPADPWPCPEESCTPERVEWERTEEAREAEEGQWADYMNSQIGWGG
jgi:hypothetical protein